jgi:hypothetical protein
VGVFDAGNTKVKTQWRRISIPSTPTLPGMNSYLCYFNLPRQPTQAIPVPVNMVVEALMVDPVWTTPQAILGIKWGQPPASMDDCEVVGPGDVVFNPEGHLIFYVFAADFITSIAVTGQLPLGWVSFLVGDGNVIAAQSRKTHPQARLLNASFTMQHGQPLYVVPSGRFKKIVVYAWPINRWTGNIYAPQPWSALITLGIWHRHAGDIPITLLPMVEEEISRAGYLPDVNLMQHNNTSVQVIGGNSALNVCKATFAVPDDALAIEVRRYTGQAPENTIILNGIEESDATFAYAVYAADECETEETLPMIDVEGVANTVLELTCHVRDLDRVEVMFETDALTAAVSVSWRGKSDGWTSKIVQQVTLPIGHVATNWIYERSGGLRWTDKAGNTALTACGVMDELFLYIPALGAGKRVTRLTVIGRRTRK